jgi:aspartyl-tRNA(Asn)/glutamyl-tRNA(Gln) amidotransferase subunit C
MSNTKITQDDFLHIAKLSRIPVTDADQYIANQLSQAAEYSAVLSELNTDNTPTTFQVNNKKNTLRPDIITPSLPQSVALSQAKSTYNGYFKTKATISKK